MKEEFFVSGRNIPNIDPSLHIWHWQIPVYLFLGGLAAGILFFAGLYTILGKEKEISTISLGCMQDIKSWIFFPKKVEYFVSNNGDDFIFLGAINTTFSDNLEGSFINDCTLKIPKIKARYIKVKAKNYGICPNWHLGAGGKTWLFVDELIIK